VTSVDFDAQEYLSVLTTIGRVDEYSRLVDKKCVTLTDVLDPVPGIVVSSGVYIGVVDLVVVGDVVVNFIPSWHVQLTHWTVR
jgi:hypothetical protein